MSVIPFNLAGAAPSVVVKTDEFQLDRNAILMLGADLSQIKPENSECNVSYDLRIGDQFRDHRLRSPIQSLEKDDAIVLLPGIAAIIETEEEVHFPKSIFGHILPRVSLLQEGIANTPSKVDPGYRGRLLITVFNHGKETVKLKKGQKFCALYLMGVDPPARPYDKQGKQLTGPPGRRKLRVLHDWIDAHLGMIVTVQTAATLAALFWGFYKK